MTSKWQVYCVPLEETKCLRKVTGCPVITKLKTHWQSYCSVKWKSVAKWKPRLWKVITGLSLVECRKPLEHQDQCWAGRQGLHWITILQFSIKLWQVHSTFLRSKSNASPRNSHSFTGMELCCYSTCRAQRDKGLLVSTAVTLCSQPQPASTPQDSVVMGTSL